MFVPAVLLVKKGRSRCVNNFCSCDLPSVFSPFHSTKIQKELVQVTLSVSQNMTQFPVNTYEVKVV